GTKGLLPCLDFGNGVGQSFQFAGFPVGEPAAATPASGRGGGRRFLRLFACRRGGLSGCCGCRRRRVGCALHDPVFITSRVLRSGTKGLLPCLDFGNGVGQSFQFAGFPVGEPAAATPASGRGGGRRFLRLFACRRGGLSGCCGCRRRRVGCALHDPVFITSRVL